MSPSKSHSRAVSCPSQILGAFRCTISFMKEMAQFGAFKRRKAVAIFKIRQNRNQRTKMLLVCGSSERPCSSEISTYGGQNLIRKEDLTVQSDARISSIISRGVNRIFFLQKTVVCFISDYIINSYNLNRGA